MRQYGIWGFLSQDFLCQKACLPFRIAIFERSAVNSESGDLPGEERLDVVDSFDRRLTFGGTSTILKKIIDGILGDVIDVIHIDLHLVLDKQLIGFTVRFFVLGSGANERVSVYTFPDGLMDVIHG